MSRRGKPGDRARAPSRVVVLLRLAVWSTVAEAFCVSPRVHSADSSATAARPDPPMPDAASQPPVVAPAEDLDPYTRIEVVDVDIETDPDARLSPARLDALRAGISRVRSDPARAATELVRSGLRPARPWLLYLDWLGGRRECALRHLTALLADLGLEYLAETPDLTSILGAIRRETEAFQAHSGFPLERLREILPCDLFAWHPAEAVAAWSAGLGYPGHDRAFEWREHCLDVTLAAALPPARARALHTALVRLEGSPYRVYPWGEHESVELSALAAQYEVEDLLLAPEAAADTPAPEAELRRAMSWYRTFTRPLDSRVARFRQVAAQTTPAIAEGLCAVAVHRGRPIEPSRCLSLARVAAVRMLVTWLSISQPGTDDE